MESSARARVLVADDHVATRAGIRAALEAGGLTVCAEAGDRQSAVERALAERPDVCLVDVRMPGGGIAAAAEIAAAVPETAIVMLTASRDDADLFAALRVGAVGYLLKDLDSRELPAALTRVLDGEAALPPALVLRLVDEFRARGARRVRVPGRGPVDLTPREWEVLSRLRAGDTTAEIAGALSVTPVTVRRHVSDILRKLRVRNRREALALLAERSET